MHGLALAPGGPRSPSSPRNLSILCSALFPKKRRPVSRFRPSRFLHGEGGEIDQEARVVRGGGHGGLRVIKSSLWLALPVSCRSSYSRLVCFGANASFALFTPKYHIGWWRWVYGMWAGTCKNQTREMGRPLRSTGRRLRPNMAPPAFSVPILSWSGTNLERTGDIDRLHTFFVSSI